MLGELAVILFLLMAVGSAETIVSENYSFIFDIEKPHQLDNSTIKTFDGKIMVLDWVLPLENYTLYWVGHVWDKYHIFMESDLDHYIIIDDKIKFSISSTMNLTDTIDFLKTLKVEKITQQDPPDSSPSQ